MAHAAALIGDLGPLSSGGTATAYGRCLAAANTAAGGVFGSLGQIGSWLSAAAGNPLTKAAQACHDAVTSGNGNQAAIADDPTQTLADWIAHRSQVQANAWITYVLENTYSSSPGAFEMRCPIGCDGGNPIPTVVVHLTSSGSTADYSIGVDYKGGDQLGGQSTVSMSTSVGSGQFLNGCNSSQYNYYCEHLIKWYPNPASGFDSDLTVSVCAYQSTPQPCGARNTVQDYKARIGRFWLGFNPTWDSGVECYQGKAGCVFTFPSVAMRDTREDTKSPPPEVAVPADTGCLINVNIVDTPTATCVGSAGVALPIAGQKITVVAPSPSPTPAAIPATEGTQVSIFDRLGVMITDILNLPQAILDKLQLGAPIDYWRNWIMDRYRLGDWVPGWVVYWRGQLQSWIAGIKPPAPPDLQALLEGCWLSNRVGEPCTSLSWAALWAPVNAKLTVDPPFPFSLWGDVSTAVAPFVADPVPISFDQWLRAMPCSGSYGASSSSCAASGYSWNEHVYLSPDELCLGNTPGSDACVKLFGYVIPGGMHLIELIKVVEIIVVLVAVYEKFKPKPIVNMS